MSVIYFWQNSQVSKPRSVKRMKPALRECSKTCGVILLLLMASLANAAEVEEFIPEDCIFYVKFQDLDEVYNEIEISENWEKAIAISSDVLRWEDMQQGLLMLEGMLGMNPLDIIETVGYRTAFAVWQEQFAMETMGAVIHSGGNLDKLKQLTKIVEGILSSDTSHTLRLDAGVYQRVRYNALVLFGNSTIIKYGFVDDCLVIGLGDESFEKMMDTYRTAIPSIQQNPEFERTLKAFEAGEVTVFANMSHFWNTINAGLDPGESPLSVFKTVFGKLNVLDTGPFLQVAAALDPNAPESEIGLFLKEGQTLDTLTAVSGEEDLFIAVSHEIVAGAWRLIRDEIAENPTSDFVEDILKLETFWNLKLGADIIPGLTGEVALSVPTLTRFNLPQAMAKLVQGDEPLDEDTVETEGSLLFNPRNPAKWNQISNKLANAQFSVSQTQRPGVKVTQVVDFHYGELEGLAVLGFSEGEVPRLIDRIKQKSKPAYLKQLPKNPAIFAQLNVAGALETKNGSPPADKRIVEAKAITPLLAWISVDMDEVSLVVTPAEKETIVEEIAKLVPFFIWYMGDEVNPQDSR